VTLRGPVPSEQQRAQIESMARSAGATRIDNELEIESDATGERG
jgi:osmotically-inducible protein OsmY